MLAYLRRNISTPRHKTTESFFQIQCPIEGSLEVKFPTLWTDEKQRWEEPGKRREEKKEDQRRERVRRKKMQAREKVEKVAKHCGLSTVVFALFWGSGSKTRLAKAAGAEPSGQMRGQKLHAVVAGSKFKSLYAKNTAVPKHFWKFRYPKSARSVVVRNKLRSQTR